MSTTYSDMSESAGKFIKRYVVHPKDRSKRIFLILGIGHSSDECKVLGDFGSKYSKIRPTKYRGHDPATVNKFNRHKDNNYIANH